MIDISDGLLQDLGHICKASHVGAIVAEATAVGSVPLLTGREWDWPPSLRRKRTSLLCPARDRSRSKASGVRRCSNYRIGTYVRRAAG
jgi:hypothetical protein